MVQTKRIRHFKQAELLSHILPYETHLDTAPKKQVMLNGVATNINAPHINLIDEDNVRRAYHVKKVKTNNDGLVCFVLYSNNPANNRVHVVFRGTHNKASALRDLETMGSGPGSVTFEQNKAEILRTIKQVVSHKQQKSQPVALSVAGHSLGGADAQMCATAILADIAENDKNTPLAKIASLNIMHANSAGVSHATAKTAKQSLKTIRERKSHLKISQHIIHVGMDGVQQSGYTNILARASSEDVETHLLRADMEPKYYKLANKILLFVGNIIPVVGLRNTYIAHTTMLLHGKQEKLDIKFKLHSNKHPHDAKLIRKHMEHKVLRRIYKTIAPKRIYKNLKRAISYIPTEITNASLNKSFKSLAATLSELPNPAKMSPTALATAVNQTAALFGQVQTASEKFEMAGLAKFMQDAIEVLKSAPEFVEGLKATNMQNLPQFNQALNHLVKSYEKNIVPYMENILDYAHKMQSTVAGVERVSKNFNATVKLSQEVFGTCKEIYSNANKMNNTERLYAALGVCLSIAGMAMQIAAMVNPAAGIPLQVALGVNALGCKLCTKAVNRFKAENGATKVQTAIHKQEQEIAGLERSLGTRGSMAQVFGLKRATPQGTDHTPNAKHGHDTKHKVTAKSKRTNKD
jgi:hypothetical protein